MEAAHLTRRKQYWHKTRRLTGVLMLVWFVSSFVMAYYARELSAWHFFGWPFSFYMSAQGSLIIYVVIIYFYARRMRRLDREYAEPVQPR